MPTWAWILVVIGAIGVSVAVAWAYILWQAAKAMSDM